MKRHIGMVAGTTRAVMYWIYTYVVLACTGCATIDDSSYVSYEGSDGGYLVASITAVYASRHAGAYSVYYHSISDSNEHRQFSFLTKNMFGSHEVHFEGEKEISHVSVFRIPPGDYVFSGWSVTDSGGIGGWESKGEFSDKESFVVEPGETTYIGDFVFVPYYGTNTFGMEVLGGFAVVVRDNRERDMEVAERLIAAKEELLGEESEAVVGIDSDQ